METRIAYSIVKELREPCSRWYRDLQLLFNAAFYRLEAQVSCWHLVEMSGIEPLTPCLQSRCSPI